MITTNKPTFLLPVTEYKLPRGERIERQSLCLEECKPKWDALSAMGFTIIFEVLANSEEVMYLTHDEVGEDYHIRILSRQKEQNVLEANYNFFADIEVDDAKEWLRQKQEEANEVDYEVLDDPLEYNHDLAHEEGLD